MNKKGTLFVSLKYISNDDTTVEFMLTEDNKQIFYLDFISNTLKINGCENYNVLVDFPDAEYNLVYHNKTNHSTEHWN